MVIPNKGQITVFGEDVKKNSEYRHKIDYLPQIANFPSNLKVKELIKMIKDLRQFTDEDQHLIELFKLKPFLDKKARESLRRNEAKSEYCSHLYV